MGCLWFKVTIFKNSVHKIIQFLDLLFGPWSSLIRCIDVFMCEGKHKYAHGPSTHSAVLRNITLANRKISHSSLIIFYLGSSLLFMLYQHRLGKPTSNVCSVRYYTNSIGSSSILKLSRVKWCWVKLSSKRELYLLLSTFKVGFYT